jgi:hypothetical protein
MRDPKFNLFRTKLVLNDFTYHRISLDLPPKKAWMGSSNRWSQLLKEIVASTFVTFFSGLHWTPFSKWRERNLGFFLFLCTCTSWTGEKWLVGILINFWFASFGEDLGLLGGEYNGQEKQASPSRVFQGSIPFPVAFDYAQDQLDFRFSMVLGWQLVEKWVGSIGKRFQASCRVLDDCAYSLIDERMDQLNRNFKDKDNVCTDLLSLFMNALDERGGSLGRTDLQDTALNLIIAGR